MTPALTSLFFAAGVAGLAYSRFGRRVGFSNTKSVVTLVAAIFIAAFAFFFTLLKYVLNLR